MTDWFTRVFGFKEDNPKVVRQNLSLKGNSLYSIANDKVYECGSLEVVSLQELRNRKKLTATSDRNTVGEVNGDVQYYHLFPENYGACFQAASQFNLLEMVHPEITPEDGITRYENDLTQGPACAIACGAGTVYRNYFVNLDGQLGQTEEKQIDCLNLIGDYFNNPENKLWTIKNGYAFATKEGLEEITTVLKEISPKEYEEVKGLLRIGIQHDTQVTIAERPQIVTQIYCSALPVAYSNIATDKWESFSKLILEATYEATLLASIENSMKTGNRRVYLTLVGGGAFGNPNGWITDSIVGALKKYQDAGLEIRFISYGASNQVVQDIIKCLE